MKPYQQTLSVAAVYTGTVVGAGFASGREVLTFFLSHGGHWWQGLCLSGLLFALCGALALEFARRHSLSDYESFICRLMGGRAGRAMDFLVGIFQLALYGAMSAAVAALGQSLLGLPVLVGAVFFACFCSVLFLKGAEGVAWINRLLTPVLLAGGLVLGAAALLARQMPVFLLRNRPWWLSALLYVSYNMVTTVSVLLSSGSALPSRRQCFAAGFLGGGSLLVLGLGLGLVLSADVGGEFPLLAFFSSSQCLALLYGVVLLSAILTTAAGNGYGALRFLERKGYKKGRCMLFCLALPAAFLPFSRWVEQVYPLFGILGFLQLCFILTSFRKS